MFERGLGENHQSPGKGRQSVVDGPESIESRVAAEVETVDRCWWSGPRWPVAVAG